MKNNLKIIFIFALLLIFSAPQKIYAAEASMFLSSGSGAYSSAKDLLTRVVINSSGGSGINAAEGEIKFNPAQIKVKSIVKEGSAFDLWAKEPTFDNKKGTINFAGGTTKAIKNTIGSIFKIYFTPLKSGDIDVQISTSTGMVLSADGLGKNILKDADGGTFIFGNSSTVASAESLRNKMIGRILLQVERDGRSWYVFPGDRMRYFLGRPADAFNLMRKLGLGVKHDYITKYKDKTFPSAVSGKILLDVEDSGKAYYIYPVDKKAYYLGRPDDAFQIMRKLGLGILNKDIKKIPDWAI